MKNTSETNSYIIGFSLALLLTLTAYFTVVNNFLDGGILVAAIMLLAFLQLFVQASFFLHLWQEKNPRWNLLVFLSTFSIIVLVVIGSLWIMNNLDYRHDNTHEGVQKILEKEGFSR